MTESSYPAREVGREHSARLAELLSELQREFPNFRLVEKRNSRLSHWIDRFLRCVTLGRQDRYLTHYHTVIGSTLFVPPTWHELGDVDRMILLRHERVHMRQRRRFTFLGMAGLYLLPFLPFGLAYGRARLEWEAYCETLRATAELKGYEAAFDSNLRKLIIERFTGPDYGWMWPFPETIGRWYDAFLGSLPRVASNVQPSASPKTDAPGS